jgi:hypothetical protein
MASGNGNPKDELSRLQLQLSNSRLAEQRWERIRELEAELAYRTRTALPSHRRFPPPCPSKNWTPLSFLMRRWRGQQPTSAGLNYQFHWPVYGDFRFWQILL